HNAPLRGRIVGGSKPQRRSRSHARGHPPMNIVRHLAPALVAGLYWAVPLGAHDSTGVIAGKVVDQTTQQPLANVEVAVPGTPLRDLSKNDGTFRLTGVHAGAQRLRATRIGYGS